MQATKTVRDPNAPKKPYTAYFLFALDRRPNIVKNNPGHKPAEVSKLIGEEWVKLDTVTREKYERTAAGKKAEYEKAMAAYNAKKNKD